ncbi:MAG: hypothetical protein R3E50_07405 [Halioglobus sp.]
MKTFTRTLICSALLAVGPVAVADNGKDCLLQGTVLHGEQGGQGTTTVKINSISKYDEDANCNVRRNQKMEFKLPQDTRLKEAPSGSDVKYRYRTDDNGQSNAELLSVGA